MKNKLKGYVGPNPEDGLLVSYIITKSNRNASARLDRLLKQGYDNIKNDPLVIDAMIRIDILSFLSTKSVVDIAKDLIKYYKKFSMFSALLDIKNLLVIAKKEGYEKPKEGIFCDKSIPAVQFLISSGKGNILKSHIKQILGMVLLSDSLSESSLKSLKEGTLDDSISSLFLEAIRAAHEELEDRSDSI